MMTSTLPRLAEDCDLRSLPIGPVEAFLLSRVDGCSNVEDLANATGIPEETVRAHLTRLAELGAIELGTDRKSSLRMKPPDTVPSGARARSSPPRDPRQSTLPPPTHPREPRAASPSSSPNVEERTHSSLPPPASNRPASDRPASDTPSTDEPFEELRQARSLRPDLNQSLLDESNDLTREFRERVLRLFSRLDGANHYDLLGVSRRATKKEVKAAYFARVQEFHGDKFFNKNLGSFKTKIDRIFSAMTRAHDTLTRKKTRTAYDHYLGSVEETLGLSSMPAGLPFVDVNGVEHRGRTAQMAGRTAGARSDPPSGGHEEQVADEASARGAPGPAEPSGLRAPKVPSAFGVARDKVRFEQTPVVGAGGANLGGNRKTAGPDARRQLAARKLRGTLLGDLAQGKKKAGEEAPSKRDPAALREAGRELKAKLSIPSARDESLAKRYLAIADEAEEAQEWASAANALRTAAELLPNDADLTRRLEVAKLEVDRRFAARFKDQAAYEEREGQFERAAQSYERAARGKNSAELYQRAASCMLRAGNRDRKAVELGREAVALDPENFRAHLTLSRAFFSAGMFASAIAEISRALELDPKSEEAKKLQKDFKKSM